MKGITAAAAGVIAGNAGKKLDAILSVLEKQIEAKKDYLKNTEIEVEISTSFNF